jgi:hypothetical protein
MRFEERQFVLRLALLVPVALVVLGCEPLARSRECRDLARRVNTALADVEQLQVKANEPAKIRAAARRYQMLGQELGTLSLQKEATAKDVAEYRQMLADAATGLLALADAAEHEDAAALRRARQDVERHARRERVLVGKIDAYCTSHF